MKNLITMVFCFCIMGASLYGCTPNAEIMEDFAVSTTTNTQMLPTAVAEPSQAEKTTGFRMVSDGEFIYYSQYEEQGLRKISTDLSSEVLLADENSIYLNLVGDMLYYIVPDSGIWQVKTDGSERKQLEMVKDAEWLDYDNGMLYFLQDFNIYRLDLETVDKTIEELEEEYGAAAASDAATFFRSEKISDEYCDSLAVSEGHIFYTASLDGENVLYLMDSAGGEPTVVATNVNSEIFIDNGRLYYLEEDEMTEDYGVNTRICSIDLLGNDKKLHFEEMNAGGNFTSGGGFLYFTRYHPGGEDNFDGGYIYRMGYSKR